MITPVPASYAREPSPPASVTEIAVRARPSVKYRFDEPSASWSVSWFERSVT